MSDLTGRPGAAVMERALSHLRTPLYRNGYLLTLSSIGSSGFGLLFWALAAHYYPAEVVGLQSAVLSAMLLVAGIAVLSLNNVLIRYIQSAGAATYRIIGVVYALSVGASVVISLVFISGLLRWIPALSFLAASSGWLISFVVATAAWCIFSLQDYALTGLRQTQWIPIENILFSIIKLGLLIVFARVLSGFGIFAAWNIPVLLCLLPVNFLIFRYLIPEHVRATAGRAAPIIPRQVLAYASGNYLGTLFSMASTNLLPILVTTLAGARGNAYFYLPWIIVTGLQLLALNMTTSLTVEATVDQTHLMAYCRRILVQVTRLLVPAVILIVIGAPFILRIFGREYEAEGTVLLRWLALAALPNAVVMLGISLARVENRAGVVALLQGGLCVLGLGLSAALLPSLGLVGVGMAWLASQTVVALVVWFRMLRPVFAKPALPSLSAETNS